MKKLFALGLLALFLTGCGAPARESEFWKHGTMYRSWDHLKFSLYEYKTPTDETGKKSQEQDWWGIEIPYIPAE